MEWAAVVGLLIGALLGYGVRLHHEAVSHRGQWLIIRAILRFWSHAANPYLKEQGVILAPLVRLPLDAYEKAIGELVKSAAITDAEIITLYHVLDQAAQFNRGLERVEVAVGDAVDMEDLRGKGRLKLVLSEAERAQIKAARLVPGPVGEPTRYDDAMRVVIARLQTPYRQRVLEIYRGTPTDLNASP